MGDPPTPKMPGPPPAGALAMLAVMRRQHHQDVMRWRTRIVGWLNQYFPEFRTVFKAWDGKAALTALDTLPTPDSVLAQSVDALGTQFKAATTNRVGAKRARVLHTARQAKRRIGRALTL